LVTILGARVDAGSVNGFRLAWALSAALSLVTAVLGALLMRTVAEPSVVAQPVKADARSV
jgi:hypothetical protein